MEQLKLPHINTNALEKFQNETQEVIEKTQDLHKTLYRLGAIKVKLDYFDKLTNKQQKQSAD